MHGKLSKQDKDKIMNEFKEGKSNILISTTVIEVGIDVKGLDRDKEFNVTLVKPVQFWNAEKECLKDVISGTLADEQIRCNQIWALSMSFTMLPEEWERQVLATVTEHLLTPCGLRTLSPEDPEYHPTYGGPQVERDMAYHHIAVFENPASFHNFFVIAEEWCNSP